jgi:U3 small nucleolar RNA-associated protein 6
MQRGLRSCTESSDLWVDYFSLELHAANLLRQRASVLGLPVRDEDEDEEGAEEGAADGITLQDGEDALGEDAAAATATAAAQERARLRRGRAALMRGAVAVTVFNAACDARPLDVLLRLRCLSAARAAGEWTARHVVSHIIRRLGDEQLATHPDAVMARADAADDYTSGIAVFEAALAAAPSAGLFSVYADWVERRMSGATDGGALASGDVAAALEALARRALRDRVAGDTLLLSAARSLSAAGRDAAAMQLVQDGVQQLKHSVPLWTALLRATAARGSDIAALTKACVMALQAVPSTEVEPLWTEALSLCAAIGADVAPLHSCLAAHHARGAGQRCGASTGAALRVSATSQGGVTAARALWDQLAQMPGVAPHAFVTALRLEAAALRSSAGGDDLMYRRSRAMVESAIAAHGSHSEDVWRACLALEMDAPNTGTPSRAERVATMLRRANRQLGQPLADVVIC